MSGFERREGDRKLAVHLHNAVESLTSAGAAAREGAYPVVEVNAIWNAKDVVEDVIDRFGGGAFEELATEGLPERFPPPERKRGPIETRGCVMTALQDIDNALHRIRKPWPFKALSLALRSIVGRLEAEEEGKEANWENEPGVVVGALKRALRERTPVAYFAYGAINHSGNFHSGEHRHGGRVRAPNRAGWFFFEAEHGQWAGPYPTEKAAREDCGDVGDEDGAPDDVGLAETILFNALNERRDLEDFDHEAAGESIHKVVDALRDVVAGNIPPEWTAE